MKRIVLVVLTLMVGMFGSGSTAFHSIDQEEKFRRNARPIPNRYIVVIEDWATGARGENSNAEAVAEELSMVYGGKVGHIYKHAVNGYSVEMSEKEARELSKDLRVSYVEEDGELSATDVQSPVTWGLDRIDQRSLPLSNSYSYSYTASNVHVYVIDSGIRDTHEEFSGRAVGGFTAVYDRGGVNDCNGHGTHVAGTIGGATYGVAKEVRIHPVRVLNCDGSGSTSAVIAGVNWITANRIRPAVANMSLGGGASSSLDAAVNNSINSGVTYVVAAGNGGANACNFSPARVAAAITVGASTSWDARWSLSNYGSCLDLFAPGSSITSAWNTSDTATSATTGTSMAAPHVAGVVALYLSQNTSASPATVRNAIVSAATPNVITGVGTGSPTRLLYSL